MEQQTQKKRHVDFELSQFNSDDQVEMAKMYDETMKNFTEGSIVQGNVLEVRGNEVLVDIGYKSEGIIPASEFDDLTQVKPGDQVDILLEKIEDENGMVVLSKEKASQKLSWGRLLSTYKENSVVEGVIKGRIRGGLIVDVDGVDAFLPGSQIDVIPVHNPDSYIGKKYEFKILNINPEHWNIIISHRELVEERLKRKKKELLESIKVGHICKGAVKNVTDFGAFIDLDGLDGLLHITDMSWSRIRHPSEVVSVGQEIEVVILGIDHERIRLEWISSAEGTRFAEVVTEFTEKIKSKGPAHLKQAA